MNVVKCAIIAQVEIFYLYSLYKLFKINGIVDEVFANITPDTSYEPSELEIDINWSMHTPPANTCEFNILVRGSYQTSHIQKRMSEITIPVNYSSNENKIRRDIQVNLIFDKAYVEGVRRRSNLAPRKVLPRSLNENQTTKRAKYRYNTQKNSYELLEL